MEKKFNELVPSFLYFLNGGVLDFFFLFNILNSIIMAFEWKSCGVHLCYNLFPSLLCMFVCQKRKKRINLYIYNLGLKQNIIITLDDYLLSWWLRNCFSKKKMYKYNLGLKKSLGNARWLFAIMWWWWWKSRRQRR